MAFFKINENTIINTDHIVRITKDNSEKNTVYYVFINEIKELSHFALTYSAIPKYYEISDTNLINELFDKLGVPLSERF